MFCLQLYLFSDSGEEVDDQSVVTSDVIVETIATVLSAISGTIRAGADDGCSLEIINSAQVPPNMNLYLFCPMRAESSLYCIQGYCAGLAPILFPRKFTCARNCGWTSCWTLVTT